MNASAATLPASSKIAIVGGGIIGCSTAYHLAQMGQEVLLLEKAALTDKPWQLMGETQASKRPLNALLEEDLEFDQQTKAGHTER